MKSNYSESEAIRHFEELVNNYVDYCDYTVNAEMTGHLDEAKLNQMNAILEHLVNSRTMNHKYAEQHFRSGLNISANCTWEYDRYLAAIEEVRVREAEERNKRFKKLNLAGSN
jgi:hypothetical protein